MFRRMSSEPATLADFVRDKFLERLLSPVCLKGVEAPLLASLKASMIAIEPPGRCVCLRAYAPKVSCSPCGLIDLRIDLS